MSQMTWGEFKKQVDEAITRQGDVPDDIPIHYIDIIGWDNDLIIRLVQRGGGLPPDLEVEGR